MAARVRMAVVLFLVRTPQRLTVLRLMQLSHIAKNLVAAGVADRSTCTSILRYWCSTTNGNIYVNTYGTGKGWPA